MMISMPKKTFTEARTPEGETIKAQDLEFKTLKEEWNEYKLEDGTILKIKLVAGKISRGIDKQGKIYYLPNGEPLYHAMFNWLIIAEVPEKLRKI